MTELRKPPVSEKGTVSIFGPGAAPLMDSNQAAQFLGVHPRTLQRMVLRGQIAGCAWVSYGASFRQPFRIGLRNTTSPANAKKPF